MVTTQKTRCTAFVHVSDKPPARHCPLCGEVVNEDRPVQLCTPHHHVIKRAQRNRFCVDCGKRLIQ